MIITTDFNWWLALGLILPLVLFFYFRGQNSNKNPPPRLPISIFRICMLVLQPNVNFQAIWATFGQHGPIHYIDFPWPRIKIVIINDLELGKKLFNNPIFSGRPINDLWRYHAHGNYGIVTSIGKVWEEQRRFSIRKLRDAGVGNKSMEALIATEVDEFIQALRKTKGQVITPNKIGAIPLLNTLWVVLTGQRFNNGSPQENEMLHAIYEAFMRAFRVPHSLLFSLKQLPMSVYTFKNFFKRFPFRTSIRTSFEGFDHLYNFCLNVVHERRQKKMDEGEYFIDSYLEEIETTQDENSTFYKENGVKNLIATMADFVIAGGDTTTNTLAWAMLHLIRNPDVQSKIQEELDRVVGRERRPTLDDRPNCPYSTAFLYEVLRVTPMSVSSLPHITTDNVDIGPYFIEQYTMVLVNFASIHADPKIWGDPENFRPERFLSPDEQTFVPHEAMIAFSIGRRLCPGLRLALDNLFCFVSAICQEFVLKKDPNLKGLPPLLPVLSSLNSPKKYWMVVDDRH